MELFELRLNKIFKALKDHNIDTEKILLKDTQTLRYVFAELYNPPPEELSIHSLIIDTNTMELNVYVSALDYYRVIETYEQVKNLVVHPVAPSVLDIELNTKITDISDIKTLLKRICKESKKVSVDTFEICDTNSTICIDIRNVIRKVKRNKSEEEVYIIGKAIEITEKSIESVIPELKNGMNERTIAGLIESKAREFGADGFAFNSIVAIGNNTSKPHHIPGSTSFKGNEPIIVDFGVRYRGYVSDITRVILPCNLSKEYEQIKKFIEAIIDAMDNSIKSLKIGEKYSYVDEVARNSLMKQNMHRYFLHNLGHGIGVDVHEEPKISKVTSHEVEIGDVITIEPGIYIDRKFGVRIEDDIYITPSGPLKLTSLKRVIEL
uniref:M24 family metallopeptidase n=1 Tax=Ignisphaera aggregans TaxID=334771 RepID=A0A7C5XMV2_9CREN